MKARGKLAKGDPRPSLVFLVDANFVEEDRDSVGLQECTHVMPREPERAQIMSFSQLRNSSHWHKSYKLFFCRAAAQ